MPHRAIRVALAVGLAGTALTAPTPAPTAPADPAQPSAVETAPEGVPAATLLAGAAPTTVTRTAANSTELPTAALAGAVCVTFPCPPQAPEFASQTGFAVLKQPHPSVDQHATPAGGPSTPALLLLDHMRPRSALPAGRTTRLDPRPA